MDVKKPEEYTMADLWALIEEREAVIRKLDTIARAQRHEIETLTYMTIVDHDQGDETLYVKTPILIEALIEDNHRLRTALGDIAKEGEYSASAFFSRLKKIKETVSKEGSKE